MEESNRVNSNNEQADYRIKKFFLMKFIFRYCHLLSVMFLFGDASNNVLFGKPLGDNNNRVKLIIISSVLLILGGFANMFTMIFEKTYDKNDFAYKLWKIFMYVKFGISIFLTPLLDKIVSASISKVTNEADIARITLMLVAYSGSVFIRYYREYYMKPMTEKTVEDAQENHPLGN